MSANNALELSVLRCFLAEGSRRNDSVDVESVPRVLGVCDSVTNQSVLVGDTIGLSEVDHGISVVLLGTRVGIGEKGVDSVNTSELDTGLVSGDITTALQAEILPALSNLAEITLSNTLSNS